MFGWIAKLFTGTPAGPQRVIEREFPSKIVGVSHRNRDGKSRQKIIREDVYRGTQVTLVREDKNRHDSNAVAAHLPDGRQIGYLDRRLAEEVRDWQNRGMDVKIVVTEITGGYDKEMSGVNVLVTVYEATSAA